MTKSVIERTVLFDETEVQIHWLAFLEALKKYGLEHFVRSGEMTVEEVKDKVTADQPYLKFKYTTHENGDIDAELIGIKVDVTIQQNIKD